MATPVLSMTDKTLNIDQDFDVSGTISGNPKRVYVEGLLRGWRYTYSAGNLNILGDAEDVNKIESGIWKVVMVYDDNGTETEETDTVDWSVEHVAPVITDPGTQTFYQDTGINLIVDISNRPAGVSIDGLLAKMKYESKEDGAVLNGYPDRVIPNSEGRQIIVKASNAAGTATQSFGFNISSSDPPTMSTVNFTGFGTFTWTSVSGATSYAYSIELDPEGDRIWVDVGNVTSHTISEFSLHSEFPTSYVIQWRVNSPWIGDPVHAFILFVIVDFSGDGIGIFDISGKNSGETLDSPAYLNLQSGWTNPTGITHYKGTQFAIVDYNENDIGIFDISGKNSGDDLDSLTYFDLPSGWTNPRGITHYQETQFAIVDDGGDGIGIFDISGKNRGDTLDSPTYFDLPSGWTNPTGITHYKGTQFAVVDIDREDIGIFDISGKNSGDTLDSPTYFNFPSGWTDPRGVTHYQGTQFAIIDSNDFQTNYIGIFDISGKNSGDTLDSPTYFRLSSGRYYGIAFYSY